MSIFDDEGISVPVGLIITFLVVVFGITWAVQGNNFFLTKFFAPKEEAVRYETFKQSAAYNDGMAQELESMQLDYIKANPEQKVALRSIIHRRYAAYDKTKMPPDLQTFFQTVEHDSLIQGATP
jgi:hypothetical protein